MNKFSIPTDRLADKDHEAFLELFDTHYTTMHAVATVYVQDSDTADDIVQDTLLYLYENSGKLRDVRNLPGFLRIVIRRRSLNYLRSINLSDRNKILFKKELEMTRELDRLEESEFDTDIYLNEITEVMESLPESCREIFRLRFVEGYKINEISQMTSLSPGTVKSQLFRAKIKIRQSLEGKQDMDERTIRLITLAAVLLSSNYM